MKNLLILTLLAFAVTFFLSCNDTSNPVESLDGATLAGAGGEGCATIQDGLLDSQGNPIVLGFDKWGYNYQAHIFNGLYENFSRPNPPVTASDFKLQMKWNAAWLSNTDCDGDGRLDRFYGFDSYIGSGAWLTKNLSVNNTSFSECDNSCSHVQQSHISFGEFLISYQEFPEAVKPRVTHLNHPAAGFVVRVHFLLLDFFPPLLYMRDIISGCNGL